MCTLCTPCALLCTAARYKWCSMILSKLCHSPEELTLKIWEKSLHRDWNWGLDTPGYHKPSIVQCYIKSDRKWMLLLNNCYKIVSGHFFAICIFIFHKTEVQTVILRCLTGLNPNLEKVQKFKSYGLRCSRRPSASSVNFWKIASDKWPFYDHIWPFFGNYMIIFDKTEIQTVILRCLTSLNLNWYKSYDTKPKNAKNGNLHFFTKSQKNGNGNICVLLHLRP